MRFNYQRSHLKTFTQPLSAPLAKSPSPLSVRTRPAADKPKVPPRPSMKTELSAEEEKTYGDRCPSGYRKIRLLGKGGCAVVWLGQQEDTGRFVAMKQVSKANTLLSRTALDACKREVTIGTLLSTKQYTANIAQFITSQANKSDLWAIFEAGGESLSKAVFDLKGEFCKGERVYRVSAT